jgi:hypothetical protein
MRSAALAVGVAALLIPQGLKGQAAAEGLEGAWRVSEVVTTGPGARTLGAPQPGLLLFTGRYYSYTLVTGDEPRPAPPGGLTTAEDLLIAWNPFTANAGTFEVSGSTMTRRPIVAKSPAAMGPGIYNEYTTVGTETGPARNPPTVRYVRVR